MDGEMVIEKNISPEYEGEFADVIQATHRVAEIICTASQLKNETAKRDLFAGVIEILTDCISAIETRLSEDSEPILEDD